MKIVYTLNGEARLIEFDTVIREVHQSSAKATEHPVESGGLNVSDHTVRDADRVSVEAIVTNTPIKAPTTQNRGVTGDVRSQSLTTIETVRIGAGQVEQRQRKVGASVLTFSDEFDRVRDVYNELKAIEHTTLVDIQTLYRGGIRDYSDMVIVNMSVPREATDGSSITFSFDAVHLRIVDTQQVATPPPKNGGRKDRGKQGKKQVDDKKPQLESYLEQLKDKIKAAYGAL